MKCIKCGSENVEKMSNLFEAQTILLCLECDNEEVIEEE